VVLCTCDAAHPSCPITLAVCLPLGARCGELPLRSAALVDAVVREPWRMQLAVGDSSRWSEWGNNDVAAADD
jgi:hypothetical protein